MKADYLIYVIISLLVHEISSKISPNAPNIIIYLVDDLGWMDTRIYGSNWYSTPNIDQLARNGMIFTNGYSPNPMCTPSRASLLTGKYPSRFQITLPDGHLPPQNIPHSGYQSTGLPHLPYICPESRRYLPPNEWTVANYLQSAGYTTGFVGKWHLGLPKSYWPMNYGFNATWHGYPDNGPPLPYGYFAPYSFKDQSITSLHPNEYIVDRVTDEGINFIQSNNKSPFFLLFSQFGVHPPWQAHLSDIQKHSEIFQQRNDTSIGPQNNPIMASMIRDVDLSVGKVMNELKKMNIVNNTLVIFTSDNGGDVGNSSYLHRTLRKSKEDSSVKLPEWMKIYRQYAGESSPTNNFPLRGGKGSLYEGGLRIPFIISYPNLIPPNSISSTPISLIDIFPTIHQLVSKYSSSSSSSSAQFDGVSLLPLLENPKHQLNRTELFGFFPHGPVSVSGVSMRSQKWKFIRRFSAGDGKNRVKIHELYDLSKDIGEKNDLSDSFPLLIKEFNHRVDHFISYTGSKIPIPNPSYNKSLVE